MMARAVAAGLAATSALLTIATSMKHAETVATLEMVLTGVLVFFAVWMKE